MTIKSVFIIIIFSLFISSCSTNKLSQEDSIDGKKTLFFTKKELKREAISNILLSDINHILFLLKQNDLDALNNRFIYKKYGLYEISKNNDDNKIILNKKLQIDEIIDEIDSFEIKQEEAMFNCSPYDDSNYGWNKEGVFVSTNIKPYLSDIMKQENSLNINAHSQEEIKVANFIEKTSYEVVIPYNMVFYITKINKQWYITLIDKVKTDCSE